MGAKFYTNVFKRGKYMYHSGYDENGEKFLDKFVYEPYLFLPAEKDQSTGYRTLKNQPVYKKYFDDMKEARDFVSNFENVDNFEYFGLTNYEYVFINDEYDSIDYDSSLIRVFNFDIEVESDDGFPEPELADKAVNGITVEYNGRYFIFGIDKYETQSDNEVYVECKDEYHLLRRFLEFWERVSPDVLTGWNIETFDIPYIVNRMKRVLSPEMTRRLSPWNLVIERTIKNMFGEQQTYEIKGINTLDYLSLYKKFTYTNQESYKLDHIAYVELGDQKLDYSDYDSLHDLYKRNYQKYLEYNVKDVEIVKRLEDKMKLIDLAIALAYEAKVNYAESMTTVRLWDVIIHNHLMKQGIVIPKMKVSAGADIEGGYVKVPQTGMSEWIVSFDLNSLYPHLIMQYNISPETLKNYIDGFTVDKMLNGILNEESIRDYMNEENATIAANGSVFSKDNRGFLAELMDTLYKDRKRFKNKMIEAKKRKENGENTDEVENLIAQYNNIQMAKKIMLNSAYGALNNRYFRWFSPYLGEAITMSGQLSIRWVERDINKFMNKQLGTEDKDFVIASDTDSVYVSVADLVDAVLGKKSKEYTKQEIIDFVDKAADGPFQKAIDKSYEDLAEYVNAYEQKMQMKRECIADKGIWTAKKRYVLNLYDDEGVRFDEPKQKIMGIEAIKSSTPEICKKAIKESLRIILNDSESNLHDYIAEFKDQFFNESFDAVACPRSVTALHKWKDDHGYPMKGTPINTRASIVYNQLIDKYKLNKKYEKIKEGEKIKYCYMKLPNPIKSDVLAVSSYLPPEFQIEKYIDYDTQFEKTFLKPLEIILKEIGWSSEFKVSVDMFMDDIFGE